MKPHLPISLFQLLFGSISIAVTVASGQLYAADTVAEDSAPAQSDRKDKEEEAEENEEKQKRMRRSKRKMSSRRMRNCYR